MKADQRSGKETAVQVRKLPRGTVRAEDEQPVVESYDVLLDWWVSLLHGTGAVGRPPPQLVEAAWGVYEASVRARLLSFYEAHFPEKATAAGVGAVMAQYAGREHEVRADAIGYRCH